MFDVILSQPEIPPNTGNLIRPQRLARATGRKRGLGTPQRTMISRAATAAAVLEG